MQVLQRTQLQEGARNEAALPSPLPVPTPGQRTLLALHQCCWSSPNWHSSQKRSWWWLLVNQDQEKGELMQLIRAVITQLLMIRRQELVFNEKLQGKLCRLKHKDYICPPTIIPRLLGFYFSSKHRGTFLITLWLCPNLLQSHLCLIELSTTCVL